MNITILGGGSFGIALALTWQHKHTIRIWECFEDRINVLHNGHCPWLDVYIPDLNISSKIGQQLIDCELAVLAVPSTFAVSTLNKAKAFLSNKTPVLIASKGFTPNGKVISQEISLPNDISVLSGPSIAKELVRNVTTVVNLAASKELSDKLCAELSTGVLICTPNEDIIGTQLCGSLKNIYAIWCGICDGLNVGQNTKALIITRALKEMKAYGKMLNTKEDTFDDLCGVGDLVVTCTSKYSRNRNLGELLTKHAFNIALSKMKMVAEGVEATKHANENLKNHSLTLPLAQELLKVFEGKEPKKALEDAIRCNF